MERLTVKWKDGLYDTFDPIDVADNDYSKINYEKLLTKLGEYEDAEEQGLLLRLPCKVGDEVWKIHKYSGGGRIPNWYKIYKVGFSLNYFYDFVKTVFLTKEEAEQALKRMESE